MSPTMKLRAVETHNISLPPNSATPKTLPLTYSDTFWIPFSNTQRIFFYKIPSISTHHFLNSYLPNLKTSLSKSLHIFFPLAGSFTPPTHPTSRPYIICEDGCSVKLKIVEAETGSFDFDHIVGTDKRRKINVTEFHPLVPDLVVNELTKSTSVLALQATIFPDCGICLGITYKHVVADGKSIAAFLNTWASICRNECVVPENTIMPVFDRSLMDPNGTILDSILKEIFALKQVSKKQDAEEEVRVRGTFVITKRDIQNMRLWILKKIGDEEMHLSTHVLVCSFIWVNSIKSKRVVKNSNFSATDLCHFGQVVDCRDRYEFKSIVPLEYFGNCLAYGCHVAAKRADLESEDGLVVAVRVLGNKIKSLELDGALNGAENWLSNFFSIVESVMSVAGSPRLGVYSLDFGWGRPVKVEVVSIDVSNAISVAENVGEEGGVEIGLVFEMTQMEAFVSSYDESKCKYCGTEGGGCGLARVC